MRTPITRADLAPLVDQYGKSWHIWPSAQGWYACATRRRGEGAPRLRTPQGADVQGADARPSPTLVEDSVAELAEALARETRQDRTPAG